MSALDATALGVSRRITGRVAGGVAGCIAARRARRGQGGYTLLEVIIVAGITALLIGPLFTWMILVMRQQPVQHETMVRTAQVDLLRTVFVRDATVAGAADDYHGAPAPDTEWHTWRELCASAVTGGARPLAVLISQGTARNKTIYSVAPMRDGDDVVAGRSSLWRSECRANTGELVEERQIVEDIDPAAARTVATCAPPVTLANGDPDEPCREMALVVNGRAATKPVELRASRRTDNRSLDRTPEGNLLPIAKIRVVAHPRSDGTLDQTFTFSADESIDPDGGSLSYRWELPDGPGPTASWTVAEGESVDHTLTQVGDHWVRLTVTDEAQGTNQTYARVVLENRSPTARATVSPLESVVASESQLVMTDDGSTDPDGQPLSYLWSITSDHESAAGMSQEFLTPNATFDVPEWAVGPLTVMLTVRDSYGASDSLVFTNIAVLVPGDPDAPDPTTTTVPTDPGDPAAPVAVFTGAPTSGNTVRFDASGSSGDGISYQWRFDTTLNAGSGSGAVVEHTYPGPGTYRARLTVTDSSGRTAVREDQVVIPGTPAAPTNVRMVGANLVWDARPGARRYLVDMRATSNGCSRGLFDQVVAPSASPRKALPPSPCSGEGFRAEARVGVEGSAGGTIAWSEWVELVGGGNEVVK